MRNWIFEIGGGIRWMLVYDPSSFKHKRAMKAITGELKMESAVKFFEGK
jgi:hypothetical protein